VIVAPDRTLNLVSPVLSKSIYGTRVTGMGTINMSLAMDVFFSYHINTTKVVYLPINCIRFIYKIYYNLLNNK
jgi:hypothetical protein